jgi:hypothetical protein
MLPSANKPAVHRAIVCVDVERFGDRRRTNPHQVAVREGVYQALNRAFTRAGVGWPDACYHEDRGDGALILVPPEVPKNILTAVLPRELAAAVESHNVAHDRQARIRLRLRLARRRGPLRRAWRRWQRDQPVQPAIGGPSR